jgi:TPP-dependent pyruvate/acetoin dehydrogenase alpha subunit
LRQGVVDRGLATEEEFDAIDAEIKAIVTEGLEFATNSPYPDPSTAANHIFSSR